MVNHPQPQRKHRQCAAIIARKAALLVSGRLFLRRDEGGWYDPDMDFPPGFLIFTSRRASIQITPTLRGVENRRRRQGASKYRMDGEMTSASVLPSRGWPRRSPASLGVPRHWPTREACIQHLEAVRWGESPTCRRISMIKIVNMRDPGRLVRRPRRPLVAAGWPSSPLGPTPRRLAEPRQGKGSSMKAKRNHPGRIEATAGLKAVDAARFVHRRAFEAACRHDGIDPSAPLVVFSDKNPSRAVRSIRHGPKQLRAPVRISVRRATLA